jgi:hypothetical protein
MHCTVLGFMNVSSAMKVLRLTLVRLADSVTLVNYSTFATSMTG